MSSSSRNEPRRRRKLPSLSMVSSRQQKFELQQRQQSPTKVDVERLTKLPPHILKQLRTVENDPAILTGKVNLYNILSL